MTAPPVTVPVGEGVALRRGVASQGPDNVIMILAAGDYPASAQCAGEEFVDQTTGARNFWWVRITAEGQTGWITAVGILLGGDDEEIPGVPPAPTVNE